MKPDNPIILALDYSDLQKAWQVLSRVRPHIGMVKIGLELFTAIGQAALDMAKTENIPVFLDLKLHDVPTTVSKTTEVICSMLASHSGNHFLSVHCFGGAPMCKAAMIASQNSNVTIAGVTILTSIAEPELHQMGFKDCRPGVRTVDTANSVFDCMNDTPQYDQAGKRMYNGMSHFICAPNQLKLMRDYFDGITLITPGIRAEADDSHDHQRTKPAGFALKNGADWLVIGRPITGAPDPREAAQYYQEQAKRYG